MTGITIMDRRAAAVLGAVLMMTACTASTTSDNTAGGSIPAPTPAVTELCDRGACVTLTRDVPMSTATTVDVYVPEGSGPWPTVVFLHGDPPSHYPIVEDIALAGAVVFNARWRPPPAGSTVPELSGSLLTAMQDAACAVSFASAHADEYGGDMDRVVVAGHSAGGAVAMVAALMGNQLLEDDPYDGDCAYNVFFDGPSAVVGLAGSYDPAATPGDPRNALRESDPDLYQQINPLTHLGSNPELEVRLLHGTGDTIIPPETSIRFHEALRDAGYEVELTMLEDVGHHLTSPDPPNPPEVYETVIETILEAVG